MADNEKPGYDFREHYRQERITKLVEAINRRSELEGTYDPSPKAQNKLRKELNKYTSPELYDMIKYEELKIEELSKKQIAARTKAMLKAGILSRCDSDPTKGR